LSKLKIITAQNLEKLLFVIGFYRARQKGSHVFYKHPDGRATSIPHHKGKTLARPLLRSILRDIKLSLDDFDKYLKNI